LRRVLGTTEINLREWAWALVPAIALLALWEAGKLIARRAAPDQPSADQGGAGARAGLGAGAEAATASGPPLPKQRASSGLTETDHSRISQ